MPSSPIIDAHLHLWNPGLIRYPWLDENTQLNRPFLLQDYRHAIMGLPVEAMVFVQCEAEARAFEREAEWVSELAKLDDRIRGLVAWAPLERGRIVTADLERLAQYDILRGIRRIIQFESDPNFCLQPQFIEGVRTLKDFNLSFDICISHLQMGCVLEFAAQIPEVPMILDHIGKPPIREGTMMPWAKQLRALARLAHVSCKISGVATEADHRNWKIEELRRYVEIAIDAFGFDRILFGGDWPVSTQAIRYEEWVRILERILAGVAAEEQRKFWHDNAARIYRLNPAGRQQ